MHTETLPFHAPTARRMMPVLPRRETAMVGDLFDVMGVPMQFARNEEVYGEGEPADYLYKVKSGCVRTYTVSVDGRRQIGSFYLPGDVFGFEAGAEHSLSAEAIASGTVQVVKRATLTARAVGDASIARQLLELTCGELRRAQDHMGLLVRSAAERVAGFLLALAKREGSATEVVLPMSRQDIADYLGLTIETVSRTLTQLENTAAIALPSARRVVLRNATALRNLTS
ncbi:MAG: helix-turn-helix domain-containing protein [Pseudolabrys sp.]